MESLPSYQKLKSLFPSHSIQRQWIEKSRQVVRSILRGDDPRLLLIAGPCSIHDLHSAREFAHLLKQLMPIVASSFYLIMRVYFEKPRTAFGWRGFLYDPLLDGSYTMHKGIEWTREFMLEMAALEVPVATEFLDPLTAFYYDDLVTWGCIGARTVSSQTHRNLASALSMPMGFKNGVAGNISAAVDASLIASHPNAFMRIDDYGNLSAVRSLGNPDSHIVLRGGEGGPNYDPASVSHALSLLASAKLPSRLIIDCSHHNSGKKYEQQMHVFQSVIHQVIQGNTNIKGLMLESHLQAGNQILKNPSQLTYGLSITDPCLDWTSTSHLIQWGDQYLLKHQTLDLNDKCKIPVEKFICK